MTLQVVKQAIDDGKIPKRDLSILRARYENKPIQAYDSEYFESEKFTLNLLSWSSLVGVRTPPDAGQISLIREVLTEEFENLTLEEIEVALKMNLLDEFDKPVEHFNYFNVSYLTAILRQYLGRRQSTEKRYRPLVQKANFEEKIMLTELQKSMIVIQGVFSNFKRHLAGFETYGISSQYEWLKTINFDFFTKEEEQEEYKTCVLALESLIATTLDRKVRESMVEVKKDEKRLFLFASTKRNENLLIKMFEIYKDSPEKLFYDIGSKFCEFHGITSEQFNQELLQFPEGMLWHD